MDHQCPFCTLRSIDAQFCNVKVKLKPNGAAVIFWSPNCFSNVLPTFREAEAVQTALFTFALCARDISHITTIGTYLESDTENHHLAVECIGNNFYKICYHAKSTGVPSGSGCGAPPSVVAE
jgi:hypothetical protein